jgi:RimJ/RimL family protein N-acetyltransferase
MSRRPKLPIRTARLILRPFVAADLDAIQAIYGRADVVRYLYSEPSSVDDAERMLERISVMTGFDDDSDRLRLAAILTETGELIGDFGCWQTSREHRQGEIAYVLHPDHNGHGYATEGAIEMLRAGFEACGFHRIVGRCDARNASSVRVMERLGMRREAHRMENEFVKGQWTDGLEYALLDRDWRRRGEGPR